MNLNSQRETIFDTIGCVHLNIKRKDISSEKYREVVNDKMQL